MGWELVQDGNCKCWLNLDEIGKTYRGYDWKNSVGKKIGIRYKYYNDEVEEKWFIIDNYTIKYLIKHGTKGGVIYLFLVDKDKNEFKITTNYLLNCKTIAKLFNKRTKDFKYNIGDEINDIVIIGRGHRKNVNNYDVKYYKYQCKCGNIDWVSEGNLKRGDGCNICSDGISYPEKFMANILSQLNIKFITQLNHTTFDWCQNFRYDFYLTDYDMIIETHGLQHYKGGFKAYEKEHENDLCKYDIAVLNGFEYNKNYFVIDSRKSTLEWMKKNIIETLGHIFDFSNVDWKKADKESQHSHMILACQLKRENNDLTVKEIVEIIYESFGIKYNRATITNWLNNGTKIGLCYYDGKEEMLEANKGEKNLHSRKVVSVDPFTKQIVFIWQYKKQATKFYGISRDTLNYYLKGKRKTGHLYNGFLWYYADEWEQLTK